MKDIPIVLQRLGSDPTMTVAVRTNDTGYFRFDDVPSPGDYQVVEKADWTPTPGAKDIVSFNIASMAPLIKTGGVTPTLAQFPNVKSGANKTDGVGEIVKIVKFSGDIRLPAFVNGPVKYTPFSDATRNDAKGLTQNYLTGLDNGTFGSYPQGTGPENNTSPYPIGSQYRNSSGINPGEGEYVNRNSRVSGATWWNLSGHTTGDERDRFITVNGGGATQTTLSQDVSVQPNSKYLISAWFMNVTKGGEKYHCTDEYGNQSDRAGRPYMCDYANPQVKLIVKDQNDKVLYTNDLGGEIQKSDMPEWKQYGDVIQTNADTTKLKIQLEQRGGANEGNDYAVDDIQVLGVPTDPKNVTEPKAGLTPDKKVNGAND
jgi:hypothetical protein